MRSYGRKNYSTELYEDVEINGETFQFYVDIPGGAFKKATKLMDVFFEQRQKFEAAKKKGLEGKELEEAGALDTGRFAEALIEALPALVPEETATALMDRFEGRVAPVLLQDEAIEIASDLIGLTTKKAQEEVGKAKPGSRKSGGSAPTKKSGQKSQVKPLEVVTN